MKKRYIPFVVFEVAAIILLIAFLDSLLEAALAGSPIEHTISFLIVPIIIALAGIIAMQVWSR